MGLGSKEIGVPHAQQTSNHWNVLLKWCLLEVLVHSLSTCKELVEVIIANVEGNAQANGAPDAVSSTDPVGETEHILLIDTKFSNFCLIGGQSYEVLSDVGLLSTLQEP